MKPATTALALALTTFALSSLAGAAAAAPTKKECAAAYEQTQALRADGKLTSAHEQAVVCAADACPAVVRGDCARWLQEIEASQPTAVFQVIDPQGQETAAVRLHVDGQLVRERLDGKAVPIDPGERVLRFEIEGAEPVEQRTVIREGEKLRTITVKFPAAGGAAGPGPDVAPPAEEADEGESKGGGAPALAWVLGGVGVVGIGVGATFGVLGLGQKSDLEEQCAPRCTDDEVASVRTKLILADVGVGVGAASLVVATVLFLTARGDDEPKTGRAPRWSVGAAPMVGGAYAGVAGVF